MIETLTFMMTSRDSATAAHARRVQQYATILAREVCGEDDRLVEAVQTAALVHDVGKLALPDRLLCKPGPLTREEYEQVKQHAAFGADMLQGLTGDRTLSLIVRHHHENWDGSGYPDGLRGEEIPLGARLLSIVDCYDSLTSERPYRHRLSHDCALAMIEERRGSMYDPSITGVFLRIVDRLRDTPAGVPETVFYPFGLWTPRVI
jgi:putative nucleotidyltransferase with HDIG domain